MLRITQSTSVARAKSYFSRADYYSEGQELIGRWHGEAAKRLGLSGEIKKEAWDALCDNRNPATGKQLTLRYKQYRRVGYDFTFDVPKSVSVLFSITRDQRILDAFRDSVGKTMRDIESEMKTRVRKGGKDDDRTTGNLVWGEYVHFTSRPVDGVPDPHLHAHCFVFNTTWDDKEHAWKAGQFGNLKRDAPYFEAKFHARLGRRFAELGIGIERTKTGWEVAGVPKSAIKQFSRRTALIEEEARRQNISSPAQKSELGAKTRERKNKELTFEQLQKEWSSRLSDTERFAIGKVGRSVGGKPIGKEAEATYEAVQHAADHCFERKSVLPERTLLTEALKHAVGKATPEEVEQALAKQDLVFGDKNGQKMVTTRGVLDEESRMIAFARDGRGSETKLGTKPHVFTRDWLNEGQRDAVRHVLESGDRVILIRGAAGTGKTAMMKEAVEAIEAGGKQVFTFAPSATASRGVLRNEGFKDAETVARLLIDEKMQAQIRGQVIWIDEAGLVGNKTMARVFDLAERIDGRVILSGDRKQHGSVERGAALRLLEEEAGLSPADITDIQRQKGSYKQVVQHLADGRTEAGFKGLDELGWVRDVPDDERYKIMAADYVEAAASGRTALVVSPTHKEKDRITGQIRRELKKLGRIDGKEHSVLKLSASNFTEAQRADDVNYTPGDVIEFHQNAKGYKKGQRIVVASNKKLPLTLADKFQVYHRGELDLARGDIVRVTKNGSTADGKHRLNNGDLLTIKEVSKKGEIVLSNGWRIAKDFGFLDYGFCVTSQNSQGRTVDRVFIGQSAESFAASSREQFYVSVSRGRHQAMVYTDDKQMLLEAVSKSDDRLTATEFVNMKEQRAHGAKLQSRQQPKTLVQDRATLERESREYER